MPGFASTGSANPRRPFLHLKGRVRTISLLVLACGCASVAEGRIDGKVSSSPATQIREEVRPSSAPPIDPKVVEQLAKGGTVSLGQLIGFALRTSPSTRAPWA